MTGLTIDQYMKSLAPHPWLLWKVEASNRRHQGGCIGLVVELDIG